MAALKSLVIHLSVKVKKIAADLQLESREGFWVLLRLIFLEK
jgi:hypothetical protein